VHAYQLVDWQQPAELRDVPVPEPGPGEVLLRVGGAGACHSDLHLMEWPAETLPYDLPFTLGHENAGWVEAFGAGVTGLEPGDPVAVYGPWGCGRCRRCRVGMETLCERAAELGANGGGLGLDGGMAEFMLVPSPRLLVPLGDLDPRDAAPLCDAALTPYHAIRLQRSLLVPGSTAVVIGCGGLGHMAVQILRAVTAARIVAVDIDEAKLELARHDRLVRTDLTGEPAVEEIRELTRGLGADVVFDVVGNDTTLTIAAGSVRAGGGLSIIGLAGGSLPVQFGTVPFDCSVMIPYWGGVVELMEVLELAAAGKIAAYVERFPLDRVEEVYDRLRAGTVEGRAVVTPNG
jgi:alcohol dehydrogenase, propanol-preferring